MEALVLHQRQSEGCLHTTSLVLVDRPDAGAIERAERLGLEVQVVPLPTLSDATQRRLAHEQAVHGMLLDAGIEVVVLSGWMRLLTPSFVRNWRGCLLNIHPSLLPAFPGAHAHRDALAAGVARSGCTVHFVDEGMDTGPIIAQAEVPVLPDDDEARLAARVRAEEHRLYPEVLDAYASGSVGLP